MQRPLAGFLTCALMAFGQRTRTPEPPAKPAIRCIDLLAFDANGRPVTNLSAADFEIVQSGQPRKITRFAWFDTNRHAARSSESPPVELVPDEIRRNFIAVIDDLGLPAPALDDALIHLRAFVNDQMGSGDRMSVLRASGGTGDLEQLTGDRRILNAALDHVQFLGGKISEPSASAATRLTLRSVLAGANRVPGRKFVVVYSSHLHNPMWDRAAARLAAEANAASTTIYGLDPGAANTSGAMETPALLRETGGSFTDSLGSILQAEENYYVLGFEEPATDADQRPLEEPVLVRVRREGVTLRARSAYFTVAAREEVPAPVDRAVQIRRALTSPFDGADIHTRLSAGFASYTGQSAAVDATVVVDLRDIGVLRDLKGVRQGSVQINIEARSEQSGNPHRAERTYDLAMAAQDYERAMSNGLIYAFGLSLPSAGSWQIRAVVADGISDRLGSSTQYVEIPPRGIFSISGLKLQGHDASDGKGTSPDPGENEAVRTFRAGRVLQFTCSIFNALSDEAKQSRIEMTTRLYAHGNVVYSGPASQVAFPAEQPNTRRTITGRLALARDVVPGDYILEVAVVDRLAPPNAPRSATRFIDFHLHE